MIILVKVLNFMLEHSWLLILCQFQVYSKVIKLYIDMYLFFFKFFSPFFLLQNNIPLSGYTTVYLSIYPLKDTWVAP